MIDIILSLFMMKKKLFTPLTDLPLRPSTLHILTSKGFTSVEELQDAKALGMIQLAADLGINSLEAVSIVREVASITSKDSVGATLMAPKTASQLWNEDEHSSTTCISHIITFCREVDHVIGGGIAIGELTELAGSPGAGKTQFAMQLSVNARLPKNWGGVEGETLYIDTEGSFAPDRCFSMATSMVKHLNGIQRKRQLQQLQPSTTNANVMTSSTATASLVSHVQMIPEWFTVESILSGIHVVRVFDDAAQTTTLLALEDLLRTKPMIKLVVIDSMAFHYRATGISTISASSSSLPNHSNQYRHHHEQQRSLLIRLTCHLSSLASKYRIAVLALNQMTTVKKMDRFVLMPALGESWAHAVTTRLIVHDHGGSSLPTSSSSSCSRGRVRSLELVKSPRLPSGIADCIIVESGIRSVDYLSTSSHSNSRKRPSDLIE